jgi:hypothetical protein
MIIKRPFPVEIRDILARVGGTKKHSVIVHHHQAGTPITLRSYWSGGSITHYTAMNSQGHRLNVPVGGSAFDPPVEPWVPQAGDILVRTGTTQGKPSYPSITFYEEEQNDD